MDLTPTDEQRAFREAARAFLADVSPMHRVSELAETGCDPAVWKRIAEMGWIGLTAPEDLGGAGAGLAEETALFAELGEALLPAPLFSTVALCLPLLQASPAAAQLVPDIAAGDRILALAWADTARPTPLATAGTAAIELEGDGDDLRVSGSRTWVLDAGHADALVVPARTAAGTEVFLVDPRAVGTHLTALSTMDTTRPAWDVRLERAAAYRILDPVTAPGALAAMRRRALLLACAEAVGVCARLLAITKVHVGGREQFGRIIGTYQGVSHQVTEMYVDLQLAWSLVLWAALDQDGGALPGDGSADAVVTAAASRVLPAAVTAAERAIQLHGGIGMTWDAPLHRYYKRALLLQALHGAPHTLREPVAHALLDC